MNWLRTYAATHLFWIILIAIGGFALKQWLNEHDARVRAETVEKQSEQVISDLRGQMAQRAQQTQKQIQVITKVVHDAKTPEQVVAAAPKLTNMPLHLRTLNELEVAAPAPELIAVLGQCKADAVNLARCEADLRDQEGIAAQLTQEKAAWKKAAEHRSFLGKVWNGSKNVLAIAGAVAGLVVVARH